MLCRATLCHAVPTPGAKQTSAGWAAQPGGRAICTAGSWDNRVTLPPSFSQALCAVRRGGSPFGVHGAAPPCSTAPMAPTGPGAVPGRAESSFLPPFHPPPARLLRHLMPSLVAGSPNRWQEEALGHHQLLLSLADDTECKFCWHYSLRLFCLCIPPVLITVIEL